MPLLDIHNLNVSYGAIQALRGVSLHVDQGQIVTLIGANGAGKSTTLRTISGLLRPVSGSIKFDGSALVRMPPHEIVRLGLIQVPEGRGIFANLSVSENIALGAYCRNDLGAVGGIRERGLQSFPVLLDRLQQNAGTLSGGEQQMLAIVRALVARPRLLLLDEPSLGLAPQITQTIFKVIHEIRTQGTTILLVEQNARMALKVADYAYVLETGKIVMQGAAAELAASDEVRKAYLGGGH